MRSQVQRHKAKEVVQVLDLGVGTGRFLEMLRTAGLTIEPHGLDISQKMIDIAMTRIPDLVSAVDDAANVAEHFEGTAFDLIGTHFITGFVPLAVLAPKVHNRLAEGGFWSFVGGTRGGFPGLQKKATSAPCKWFLGTHALDVGEFVFNPTDQDEVVSVLRDQGFEVCACETHRPPVRFRNYREFMDFAYYGGWLTPFIEAFGLHKAKPLTRGLMNSLLFPVQDHHSIVIALARKV